VRVCPLAMFSIQLDAHVTSTAISVNTNDACYDAAAVVVAGKVSLCTM
jgi:hypothetical protein